MVMCGQNRGANRDCPMELSEPPLSTPEGGAVRSNLKNFTPETHDVQAGTSVPVWTIGYFGCDLGGERKAGHASNP